MGHEIFWLEENSIVKLRLWDKLNIDEFPEYDRLILEYIDQSDKLLVHVWVDMKDVEEFPNNVSKVHKALTHLNHPRVGWSIIITDSRVIRFVGYMITQISKARFRAFSNEADGMAFLRSVDTTIPKEA
jgi:hypothetical protein